MLILRSSFIVCALFGSLLALSLFQVSAEITLYAFFSHGFLAFLWEFNSTDAIRKPFSPISFANTPPLANLTEFLSPLNGFAFINTTARTVRVWTTNATPGNYSGVEVSLPDGTEWGESFRPYLAGRVVLTTVPASPWGSYGIPVQESGAVALFIESQAVYGPAGVTMFYSYGPDADQLRIQTGEINPTDMAEIISFLDSQPLNTTILVTVEFNPELDKNAWADLYFSAWWVLWRIILCVYGLVVFSLAFLRLVLFLRYQRGAVVPIVSLSLISFGSVWRMIYTGVNPHMSTRAWAAIIDDVFFTSSFPFSLAPVFLMALYLQETLNRKGIETTSFLSKFRIVFFVVVALLFAFEIATTVLRIAQYPDILTANCIVYMLSALALLVFFSISSFQLIFRLFKSDKVLRSRNRFDLTKKVSIWSAVTIVCILHFFLAGMCLLLPYDPITVTTITFNMYFAAYSMSLVHTLSYYNLRKLRPTDSSEGHSTGGRSQRTLSNASERRANSTSTEMSIPMTPR